ncbi:MAG TPA: hypothetical protein VMD74_04715 [Candidatus Methylomirabilis sp.]|nr:hypothetical protein [Candidatus Methylomirabilis sp.]
MYNSLPKIPGTMITGLRGIEKSTVTVGLLIVCQAEALPCESTARACQ